MSDMTPEERIKAAAEALKDKCKFTQEVAVDLVVLEVLAAAYPEDFPPKPKWPSDESLAIAQRLRGGKPLDEDDVEAVRNILRADPIIQAAVELRDADEAHDPWPPVRKLRRAIDEAGL